MSQVGHVSSCIEVRLEDLLFVVIDGDVESGSLMSGQSVSLVKKLQSVCEIFNELTQQMKSQINFEQKDSNNG